MQYNTIDDIVSSIVSSFVINEYVHPHSWPPARDGLCCVTYEPIEHIPVVKGSLIGTIYNGDNIGSRTFRSLEDDSIIGYYDGSFDHRTGVITLIFNESLHIENYLCVCYEFGSEDLSQKSNWLQEGF